MSAIQSAVYQVLLLLLATFLFMVLFEHGTSGFVKNAGLEFGQLMNLATGGGGDSASAK